jgi:hypothetical protein
MQHDLQLRAAARAHYTHAYPLGPLRFDDAEQQRTQAYLSAVEAAQHESAEIDAMLLAQRQLELI